MHSVDALNLCGNGSSQAQVQDWRTGVAATMMVLLFMSLPPEALLLDFEGPTGSYLSGDKDGMEISQVN